ncbi:hypothetical protein PVAP13_1NG493319 [Panicum virgatum]|uniref:Uncharacterized protein n=1 Tax=Panicum virgatum TaxID=38727 RepID=A0A8T0X5N0_PANVG|nr:hypothetical protein PVAP13_1NG493319 [Panicum virgatum]
MQLFSITSFSQLYSLLNLQNTDSQTFNPNSMACPLAIRGNAASISSDSYFPILLVGEERNKRGRKRPRSGAGGGAEQSKQPEAGPSESKGAVVWLSRDVVMVVCHLLSSLTAAAALPTSSASRDCVKMNRQQLTLKLKDNRENNLHLDRLRATPAVAALKSNPPSAK